MYLMITNYSLTLNILIGMKLVKTMINQFKFIFDNESGSGPTKTLPDSNEVIF